MIDLWGSLLPLAIASAVVPVQLVITVLLLRSTRGRAVAAAWVAGMLTVRLAQGVVLGWVVAPVGADSGEGGSSTVASLLLLVIAILLLVMAAKKALGEPDEDAPAPRWKSGMETATPARAYVMGLVLLGVSAKLWVFTLGAIAAIEAASLGVGGSAVAYLVFVALAMSLHLGMLCLAVVAPARADVALTRFSALLDRHDRAIAIGLGTVFGVWFLIKALGGLGIL